MGKKHMVNTIPQWVKHLALGIPMKRKSYRAAMRQSATFC